MKTLFIYITYTAKNVEQNSVTLLFNLTVKRVYGLLLIILQTVNFFTGMHATRQACWRFDALDWDTEMS